MTPSQHPTLKSLLLAATILACPLTLATATPAAAQVGIVISVQIAPPILPVYSQPPLPAYGYIWTPGYWSWIDPVGYYWVPGTWVQPPVVGLLWTPPYWSWTNGAYVFNGGYWGPHVGYYGGVNYGYGYGGRGYEGGRWDNGRFAYNRTANNFGSVRVTNVYTQNVTVINNTHVSYVGGTGGLVTQPTAEERQAEQDHHVFLTAEQTKHNATAASTPDLAATRNNGHPTIAATSHPAQFTGPGVMPAKPGNAAEQATAHRVAPHPTAAGAAPALRPATQPAEHAVARPVEAAPARPAEQHAATPNPAALLPAAAREPVAEYAAPHPIHHAVVRPVEAAPARPAERHAAPPPATHPAAAHPAPAPKDDEKKKEL
jgi:hypothetical protein